MYSLLSYKECTLHVFQQPSHILSLWGSSEIIDVVNSFQYTPTPYDVYKLVPVSSLALALPGHMMSELVPRASS